MAHSALSSVVDDEMSWFNEKLRDVYYTILDFLSIVLS